MNPRLYRILIPLLFTPALGCKRLPEAPETLEELTNYLFEHFDDEDTDSLEAGIINVEAWLDVHMEQANEGYKIEDLSELARLGLRFCSPHWPAPYGHQARPQR